MSLRRLTADTIESPTPSARVPQKNGSHHIGQTPTGHPERWAPGTMMDDWTLDLS